MAGHAAAAGQCRFGLLPTDEVMLEFTFVLH
jgi:hypothetical protein